MADTSVHKRQLLDWSAAVWAGIISGFIFLAVTVFAVPYFTGGNAWVIIRLFASVILGEGILAPPATYDLSALIAALAVNSVLSMAFALLLAYIVHRGGLLTGILGGAVFGLAVYCINFYTLTIFFPWFFALKGWPMAASHILLGAMSGGIYEGLEVEEFVFVTEETSEKEEQL